VPTDADGILKGTGTTVTTVLGETVRARVYIGTGGWQSWVDLTAPSGGWTLAKAQALHLEYNSLRSSANKIEVNIYESDGGTLLATLGDFAEGDFFRRVEIDFKDTFHYLILASGDDNDITWTAPTNFTEFYEFNGASGDDSSIGAWYAKASDILTTTVDLVRSGSEELAGIMMVVQGADRLEFEDLALVLASHVVETDNVDGSPNITPEAIATVTDDAMVIVQDGVRSWAEITSDAVVPPTGYSLQGVPNPSVAIAAPGRIWSGTGNGDVMVLWMHRTVPTAGVEFIDDITGITGGNDHKTATFAIRPEPPLDQRAFRFRNDDGDETDATWMEPLNTDVTIDAATSDADFRIRFQISNDSGPQTAGTSDWKPQFSQNGGAWTDVGAREATDVAVRAQSSTNLVNNEPTTEQLAGTQVYTAGLVKDDFTDIANRPLASIRDTEHEFVMELYSANITDGDTIDLRMIRFEVLVDAPFRSYTQIPRITIGSTGTDIAVAGQPGQLVMGTGASTITVERFVSIDSAASQLLLASPPAVIVAVAITHISIDSQPAAIVVTGPAAQALTEQFASVDAPAAQLILASAVSVVATNENADIEGQPALLQLVAPAGDIVSESGIVVDGQPAALILASPAHVVDVNTDIAITSQPAALILGSPEHELVTRSHADIAGQPAILLLTGPPSDIIAEGGVTIAAPPSAITLSSIGGEFASVIRVEARPAALILGAAPSSVTTPTGAVIAAAPAALILTSPASDVVAEGGVAIAGQPAGLILGAPAHAVVVNTDIAVAAQPAALILGAPAHEIVTRSHIAVAGQPASLVLTSPPSSVVTEDTVLIVGQPAALVLGAAEPVVSTEGGVIVSAQPAALILNAPPSVIATTSVIDITVGSQPAALKLTAPVPVITATSDVNAIISGQPGLLILTGPPATVVVDTGVVVDGVPAPLILGAPAPTVVAITVTNVAISTQPAAITLASPEGEFTDVLRVMARPSGLVLTAPAPVILTPSPNALILGQPAQLVFAAPAGVRAEDFIIYDGGRHLIFSAPPPVISTPPSGSNTVSAQPAALVLGSPASVVIAVAPNASISATSASLVLTGSPHQIIATSGDNATINGQPAALILVGPPPNIDAAAIVEHGPGPGRAPLPNDDRGFVHADGNRARTLYTGGPSSVRPKSSSGKVKK
jgi:hypothetical protein